MHTLFIEEAILLEKENKPIAAIKTIFSGFNDLLSDGKYDSVDEILTGFDFYVLSERIMLATYSICKHKTEKLKSIELFFEKCLNKCDEVKWDSSKKALLTMREYVRICNGN